MKIARGDTVLVIAGEDIGHRGRVLRVFPKQRRAIVEGANFVKRHTKARRTGEQSGIVEKEAPVHVSNVMVIDSKADVPTRIGMKILADGKRARIGKKSGEMIISNG